MCGLTCEVDLGLDMSVVAAPPAPPRRIPPSGWGPRRLKAPVLSASIATVVGLVTTGVGAGIAVRHLQKTGLSFIAVTGVGLLVGGLALLVFAVIAFWRVTPGWWRLWLLPAGVAALVVLWSTTNAVMFTVVPHVPLSHVTPADRGLTYENVSYDAADDDVRIAAWFVPSTNGATVVLLPGAGSTRTATLAQAAVLARHGFGLLMPDPRGQGDSGGSGMDLGWYGEDDVRAAVGYLHGRSEVDPTRIALLGLSMGGEEAIGAAGTDLDIGAVVAEGATGRTAADKRGWLPHGVAGALQRGIDRLTYGLVDLLTPAPEPSPLRTSIIRATGIPFLLVTAGDVPDEQRAAAYLRSAAPDRVEVWTVPGATHIHGLATRPGEWEIRVVTFLERALRR